MTCKPEVQARPRLASETPGSGSCGSRSTPPPRATAWHNGSDSATKGQPGARTRRLKMIRLPTFLTLIFSNVLSSNHKLELRSCFTSKQKQNLYREKISTLAKQENAKQLRNHIAKK